MPVQLVRARPLDARIGIARRYFSIERDTILQQVALMQTVQQIQAGVALIKKQGKPIAQPRGLDFPYRKKRCMGNHVGDDVGLHLKLDHHAACNQRRKPWARRQYRQRMQPGGGSAFRVGGQHAGQQRLAAFQSRYCSQGIAQGDRSCRSHLPEAPMARPLPVRRLRIALLQGGHDIPEIKQV